MGAVAAVALSLFPATAGQAQEEKPVKKCDAKKGFTSPCKLVLDGLDFGKHAWFWMSNDKVTFCTEAQEPFSACANPALTGQPPANPSGTTSPISNGHAGVAMKDGSPDMRSYFLVETGLFPPGATFTVFDLTLLVSHPDDVHTSYHADANRTRNQTRPPATVNQDDAAMRACPVTTAFPEGANGDPPVSTTVKRPQPEVEGGRDEIETTTIQTEPPYDCSLQVRGEKTAEGTAWVFNLVDIANRWWAGTLGNVGLAIEPLERGIASTWTVEFHGAMTSVTETDQVSGEEQDIELIPEAQAASVRAEWFGGIEPPPPPPPIPSDTGPTFPSFGTDPSDQPPPVPQVQPEVPLPAAPAVPGVVPAGVANPQTSAWVWALLPLGALALGLVTSAIGEDPTWTVGAGNRVAGVLRARRLGGLAVPEGASEVVTEEST